MKQRQSGEGIVHSAIDVKKWAIEPPSAAQARPACCSGCGAASQAPGKALGLVGHGLRERQVRGPGAPGAEPEIIVVRVRRYRCRHCGGITTVLPRGLCARRHYSASAIGLSLCLFGLLRLTVAETRFRICPWRITLTQTWTTLGDWVDAVSAGRLLPGLRRSPPSFSRRKQAERAAAALVAIAPAGGALPQRAFEGAALAA